MSISTAITALCISDQLPNGLPSNESSDHQQNIKQLPPLCSLVKVLFSMIVEFAVPSGPAYCELFQYKEGGILGCVSKNLPITRYQLIIDLLSKDPTRMAAIIDKCRGDLTKFSKTNTAVFKEAAPLITSLNFDYLQVHQIVPILNSFSKIKAINGFFIVGFIRQLLRDNRIQQEIADKESPFTRIASLLEKIEILNSISTTELEKILIYFPNLKGIALFCKTTKKEIAAIGTLIPQLEICQLDTGCQVTTGVDNIPTLKNLKKLTIPVFKSTLSESISLLGNLEILELDFHIFIPHDFFIPCGNLKKLYSLSITGEYKHSTKEDHIQPIDYSSVFDRLTSLHISLDLFEAQVESLFPQLSSLKVLEILDTTTTAMVFASTIQSMHKTTPNLLKRLEQLQIKAFLLGFQLTQFTSLTTIRTLEIELPNDANQWLQNMEHLTTLICWIKPVGKPSEIVGTISKLSKLRRLDLNLNLDRPTESVISLLKKLVQLQSLTELRLTPPHGSDVNISIKDLKMIFDENSFQSLEFITINQRLQRESKLLQLLQSYKKIFVPKLRQQLALL